MLIKYMILGREEPDIKILNQSGELLGLCTYMAELLHRQNSITYILLNHRNVTDSGGRSFIPLLLLLAVWKQRPDKKTSSRK